MAITAHAPPLPIQPPLAHHPIVSTSTLPLAAQLLLAQAVTQLGTGSWSKVQQQVEHSPEWPEHDAGKLTAQGYHEAFNGLMRERHLDPSACSQPLARPSRKLVHSLYSTLLHTLRQDILTNLSEEARLNSEIAAIRASASSAPPPSSASSSSKRPRSRDRDAKPPSAPSSSAAVAIEPPSSVTSAAPPASVPRRKSGRKGAGTRGYADEDSEMDDAPAEASADRIGSSMTPVPAEPTPVATPTPAPSTLAGAEGEEDEEKPVKAEEGEEEVEETPAPEDGDEDEEEEEEEESGRRKSSRSRKGTKKGRTAAATAAKKAQQARKRKQSEQPSVAEGTETPPPADEASGSGTRRGGGRKRVKTEEPIGEEDKDSKAALQRRKAAFTRLITSLQSERYSHFFETRVTRSIAPLYNVAVYRPTCLKDILKKIKAGDVRDETELMREVALLCANAMQFNGDEGEESVGHCARLMWERFERLMDETLSTEFAAGEMA
ncbi:hypothetical protein JCM8097_008985 [Rhodosporidiobolus ruineniae]